MTAYTFRGSLIQSEQAGLLTGIRPLLRKDTTEWLRGMRAWIVLVISAAFMILTAANGWINATIAATLPAETTVAKYSLVPADNLLTAVAAQIFVLATIFAVASLIVGERQAGTLAWVASKPVSRDAIWTSKWVTSSVILGLTAAILPLGATVATIIALYGMPPLGLVVGLGLGMVALVAFFAAVGLAAGTVMPGQAAITATGFGVFALMPLISGLVPAAEPFLPTSIVTWAADLATGGPANWVTPIVWLLGIVALVGLSLRQMSRMEL